MKKYFLLAITLLFASTLYAQTLKNRVVIKGILRGDLKGYNQILLYNSSGTDSTLIDNKGEYEYSFPFKEVTLKLLYPIYLEKMNIAYRPFGVLITEPGTYYIKSDISKGMYESSEITGPESAMQYRAFERQQGKANEIMYGIISAKFGKDWYTISPNDTRYSKLEKAKDSLSEILLVPSLDDLLTKYPNSLSSSFALNQIGRQVGSIEKKEQMLSMLSASMKKSESAIEFALYINGLKNSTIGKTVENFVLNNERDIAIDLKDLKGKYVLIDFWASWCGPCRASFPEMRKLYAKYKSADFEIYSISIDKSKSAWLKAVKAENNPWIQALDTKNISQSSFAVTAVPNTFLLDPEGKIIAKELGFEAGGNGEIAKKLEVIFPPKESEKK